MDKFQIIEAIFNIEVKAMKGDTGTKEENVLYNMAVTAYEASSEEDQQGISSQLELMYEPFNEAEEEEGKYK
jgi:hypothetical protein